MASLSAIDRLIKVSPQTVSVGLQKILSLLESEEPDVRVHAVKVVANLAAEGKLHKFLIRYRTVVYCFTCQSCCICCTGMFCRHILEVN
jgi:hypothetical protein